MKAIILAGGLGERLRPITYEIPKPLLPVHGRPIVEHLMLLLKKHGITEIILSIGYKADMIKDYFKNGEGLGLKIDYVVEKERLGTAGCLNMLEKELKETFIMTNGDQLTEFDISLMIRKHKACRKKATLALLEVEDPTQYGVARLNNDLIEEFVEKPTLQEAPSNLINAGFYMLEPDIINLIKGKKFAMMEKDVFPKLAKEKELVGYKLKGQWFDIGTLERYERAIKEWKGVQ